MSNKKYNCELTKEPCEYAGNKYYNYGFVQGLRNFCRYKKRWIARIDKCPKEDSERRLRERLEEEARLTYITLQQERDVDGFVKGL